MGSGFDYGIIDDPFKSRKEADSPTIREMVWEWYIGTFLNRIEEDDACICIIMTRWHEDDLVGRLLEKAKEDPNADQWDVVEMPAIMEEGYESPDDTRKIGEALWPSKRAAEFLLRLKATIGTRNWSSLFQQRPKPDEGVIFKRHWIQFYTKMPPTFDELIQSWDMTFKDTKTSSFVSGQVWGRIKADFYLLDEVHARLDFPATIKALKSLSGKWPEATTKLVEDKANGPAVISSLKKSIPGIIAINPKGSKESRAHGVTPVFESGNVYFPAKTLFPWASDFLEEICGFPYAKFRDRVDALTQALDRLIKSASVGIGIGMRGGGKGSKWKRR